MFDSSAMEQARRELEGLDYGAQGLTRNDLRAQIADLPDDIYLHLPDSKRFRGADEVLNEVNRSAARAEGEFIAAADNTPSEGAQADNGPAGYGDDPLIGPSLSGPSANTPVGGFDGNSLETEREFPRS
jgi:hypothetical protein